MTNLPTHSLLVPCYNAQAYIDAFLSAVGKLHKPFDQVLFYDDASTDDTYQILKGKGCTVIKGDINSGPGYARNRLAQKATGQYIHFHDIDDEFNPDFLNLVNASLAVKPTDVVLGYADWIDPATRRPVIQWRYNLAEIITYPVGYFLANPLGIINTVYKKEAFEKVNGFNEHIKCWEDADLHVRLAASGASFAVIDKVIAYSLRHETGISNQQDKCWECRFKFLENYINTLDVKHCLLYTSPSPRDS